MKRYDRYSEGPPRLGWIFNMLPTSIPDASGNEKSGLDMYFLEQDGGTFKATVRPVAAAAASAAATPQAFNYCCPAV